MLNTSQFILDKTDIIVEKWIEEIRKDRRIESSAGISDTALGNSIPDFLKLLAQLLKSAETDFKSIAADSLEHGSLRARQGYDADEIAQEYGLLRRIIFSVLAPHCVKGSPQEIIEIFSQINSVLDEAISLCFKSYVQARLHELEQLQSQLTLTNQELTRLFESSKDTLSHLAHELKTPLTSVIGYSELLLRLQKQNTNTDSASLTIRSLERVLQGGRHLLRIVNDSLEISRYEANQIKLNLELIDVRSVIATVTEMIDPLAQARDLQLKIDYTNAPSKVFTDSFRLQQILTNLLGNAVRYTDVGFIQINCYTLPDEKWCLTVTDTGIGITPDDQDRIFEAYTQAFFNQGSRKHEGTGLGLSIVSRLVKLLQGEIQVDSQVGVGSTFTLTLPINVQVDDQATP